jgi:hypothetical protein
LTFEVRSVVLNVTLSLTINDTVERLLRQSGKISASVLKVTGCGITSFVLAAVTVFIWLGAKAVLAPLTMNFKRVVVLGPFLLVSLIGCRHRRYKQTTFSWILGTICPRRSVMADLTPWTEVRSTLAQAGLSSEADQDSSSIRERVPRRERRAILAAIDTCQRCAQIFGIAQVAGSDTRPIV